MNTTWQLLTSGVSGMSLAAALIGIVTRLTSKRIEARTSKPTFLKSNRPMLAQLARAQELSPAKARDAQMSENFGPIMEAMTARLAARAAEWAAMNRLVDAASYSEPPRASQPDAGLSEPRTPLAAPDATAPYPCDAIAGISIVARVVPRASTQRLSALIPAPWRCR